MPEISYFLDPLMFEDESTTPQTIGDLNLWLLHLKVVFILCHLLLLPAVIVF